MNVTTQATEKVEVRVLGAMEDKHKALDILYANGWRVTRSGPLPDGARVDPTRFELIAEKLVGTGPNAWVRALSIAFKEAP